MLALPVDYDALRIGLVRCAQDALGLGQNGVIMYEPEQPNAPRPSLPYMTIKWLTPAMRTGFDDMVEGDDTSPDGRCLYTYVGQRKAAVSFNTYGQSHEQAYGLMSAWQSLLCTVVVQQRLAATGLAVLLPSDVRDISELLETQYEGRAQMDVTFGLSSALTVQVDTVKGAVVIEHIDDASPLGLTTRIDVQGV